MTIIYRTAGAWGGGTGFDLPAATIDANFWDLHGRVTVIEAWPMPAGIDYFEIEGNELSVVMDDYTTRGPYILPTYVPNAFVWEPDIAVVPGQMFSINSTIYTVIFAHTTVDPFDPAENNGLGDNYYQEFITVDGVLPTGGAAGQVLIKTSGTDYAITWAPAGLPTGGTAGQVLAKTTGDDYDVDWIENELRVPSVEEETGSSLVLALAHSFTYQRFTGLCVVSVPTNSSVPFPIDSEVSLHQAGIGSVSVEPISGTVTINVPVGYIPTLLCQHATATLKKVGTNEWDLIGLLAPEETTTDTV